MIKEILKGLYVLLTKTYRRVTCFRRIRGTLGSQCPQYTLCLLQSLNIVDDLTNGKEVVHEV